MAALLSSYVVSRFAAGNAWPSNEVFSPLPWIGLGSLLFVIASCLLVWRGIKNGNPQSKSSWSWLAVAILGVAYICLLLLDCQMKFRVGVWPSGSGTQIYQTASYEYLAAVKQRVKDHIHAIEVSKDQLSPQAMPASEEQQLERLYEIQSGLIQWVSFQLQNAATPHEREALLQSVAWHILSNTPKYFATAH